MSPVDVKYRPLMELRRRLQAGGVRYLAWYELARIPIETPPSRTSRPGLPLPIGSLLMRQFGWPTSMSWAFLLRDLSDRKARRPHEA